MVDSVLIKRHYWTEPVPKKHKKAFGTRHGIASFSVLVDGRRVDSFLSKTRAVAKAKALRAALSRA